MATKKSTRRAKNKTTVETKPEQIIAQEVVEETKKDSSPSIAKPSYFTGSIDELNQSIKQFQQSNAVIDNGLANPALNVQPQVIAEMNVQNPLAMGSEQKAALEQQPIIKEEEVKEMVKQEQLDNINENKMEQKATADQQVIDNQVEKTIFDVLDSRINKAKESDRLAQAAANSAECFVYGAAVGMGTVAGIYVADKALKAFDDNYAKEAADGASKLISNLL